MPQTDNVFPRLSVRENLEMGLFLEPRAWRDRFETVAGLFPLLAERAGQRAGALSGGERQMLAMGRALMDEPVGAAAGRTLGGALAEGSSSSRCRR